MAWVEGGCLDEKKSYILSCLSTNAMIYKISGLISDITLRVAEYKLKNV